MKRLFDLTIVLVTLPLWAPLLLVIALLVRMKLGSPILFRQPRPGKHGRVFELLKFRSMMEGRGPRGELLPDEQRLTPFGRWLRATSLDELPELWNVLKGEVSLVGPRPLRVEYLPRYTPEQARRHEVLPGLTGWAQVHGRNAVNWEDRFKLDVWYVDHQSLWLDMRILALTLWQVLRREGITTAEGSVMPEFIGPPPRQDSSPPSGS